MAPSSRSNQFLTHTHTDRGHHTRAKRTCIYLYNMKHKIISLNHSVQTQLLRKTAAAFISGTQINHFIAGSERQPPSRSSPNQFFCFNQSDQSIFFLQSIFPPPPKIDSAPPGPRSIGVPVKKPIQCFGHRDQCTLI